MNAKRIIKELYEFTSNMGVIENGLVYSFVVMKKINYNKSRLLNTIIDNTDIDAYKIIYEYFVKSNCKLSFDDLVELFEYLTPMSKKKENGVVYTPRSIKKYILNKCIVKGDAPVIMDPSCGCGSFLLSAAEIMHDKFGLTFNAIFSKYLYGIDIDMGAIKRSEILCTLLAATRHEYGSFSFNIICANALDPVTVKRVLKECKSGFDCVIGNPPYVRLRNMTEDTKQVLNNWETASTGNVDLYMPFFEIGIRLLKSNGCLCYISPNGYIQGNNGKALRKYLVNNNRRIIIDDFRDTQIFENVTSYTCITFIDMGTVSHKISYARINKDESLTKHKYSSYDFNEFKSGAPWRMRSKEIDTVVFALENAGTPLSNWKIRNGLATLKNKLFIFMPKGEDTKYYYRIYRGHEYKIEKGLCIKVVKPNILKNESELKKKMEMAIFPYEKKDGRCYLLKESVIIKKYPEAYKFLSDNRDELEKRDKGKGKYAAWYAYGRTQGMNNFGKKILIPYIAGEPTAIVSEEEDLLFYCGYALFSDDEKELFVLKTFLKSDAFWFYIYYTSKPYAKGYMAFAKNYLTNFSIPKLNKSDIAFILSKPRSKELNEYIWNLYGVDQLDLEIIDKRWIEYKE